jgi:hypothetical protein
MEGSPCNNDDDNDNDDYHNKDDDGDDDDDVIMMVTMMKMVNIIMRYIYICKHRYKYLSEGTILPLVPQIIVKHPI